MFAQKITLDEEPAPSPKNKFQFDEVVNQATAATSFARRWVGRFKKETEEVEENSAKKRGASGKANRVAARPRVYILVFV